MCYTDQLALPLVYLGIYSKLLLSGPLAQRLQGHTPLSICLAMLSLSLHPSTNNIHAKEKTLLKLPTMESLTTDENSVILIQKGYA